MTNYNVHRIFVTGPGLEPAISGLEDRRSYKQWFKRLLEMTRNTFKSQLACDLVEDLLYMS